MMSTEETSDSSRMHNPKSDPDFPDVFSAPEPSTTNAMTHKDLEDMASSWLDEKNTKGNCQSSRTDLPSAEEIAPVPTSSNAHDAGSVLMAASRPKENKTTGGSEDTRSSLSAQGAEPANSDQTGGESDSNIRRRPVEAPPSGQHGGNTAMSLAEMVRPGSSKRTDFPLFPSKMALLIIDIQKYLSQPSSVQDEEENQYFYNSALPRTVSNIEELLKAVRRRRDDEQSRAGCEVVFTYLEALTKDCRDVSLDYKLSGPQLASLPSAASSKAKFLDRVRPVMDVGKGDIVIPKTSCSVFVSTNLHYVLQNLSVEQLVVCGQLTDQCVESAVRDAADLGYFVTVVDDACAAKNEASHSKGLSGMKGFSRIISTKQVLDELEAAPRDDSEIALLLQSAVATSSATSTQDAEKDEAKHLAPVVVQTSSTASIGIKSTAEWTPPDTSDSVIAPLLRTLQYADIQFLRYLTVDAYNSIRCKAVPLDCLLSGGDGTTTSLFDRVSIAEVCYAGLPTYGDFMLEGTNLDARRVLVIRPDLSSLRILPYARKTAVVMGTVHDQYSRELSPLCTRGLFARVVQTAEQEYGLSFSVGAEIEFSLYHMDSIQPVDDSLFGNSTTLNEQEDFISDLYDQLRQQIIEIELIHAESGPGQLEVVLRYQHDAIVLADNVVLTFETIRAVARSHKMKALFLPKTHEMKAGHGVHVHVSFRDLNASSTGSTVDHTRRNAFPHDNLVGEISAKGKSFIEGILEHFRALLSLSIPSTNSFRRVGPGCWTGHSVCWAIEDKEAPVRVCADLKTGILTNVELKLAADSTANIYLSLAATLAAGLDGIARELTLRPAHVPGLSSQPPTDPLPSSFEESLEYLQEDDFLMNIIGPELSTAYLAVRNAECKNTSHLSLEEEVRIAFQKA